MKKARITGVSKEKLSEIDKARLKDMVNVEIPILTSSGSFRYGLQRTIDDLRKLNIYPSEAGFDAIILGLLVFMADMKIARTMQAQDSWSREIILSVPVFDDHWSAHKETFERMLKFFNR